MKVYLETSFVSACVSTRTDPKSIYRRDTSVEWWSTQRKYHEIFVSEEVFKELSSPTYPNSARAMALIDGIPLLPLNEEVARIAELLIREKLMPQQLGGDTVHVAVATVHAMQYILSWNVRHLANPNKRERLKKVLFRLGRIAPEIMTPDLLWED
jgi:hypothetical protein